MRKMFDLLNTVEKQRIKEIQKAILNAKSDKERISLKLEFYEIYQGAVKRAQVSQIIDESTNEQSAALSAY